MPSPESILGLGVEGFEKNNDRECDAPQHFHRNALALLDLPDHDRGVVKNLWGECECEWGRGSVSGNALALLDLPKHDGGVVQHL